MTLLLHNHEIRGLLSLPQYISAVEDGYLEVGQHRGVNFPRENLWIAGDKAQAVSGGHLPTGQKASFKFKAALLTKSGSAGMQAYTAGLPGGLETFLFLFDLETGRLDAVMEVLYYDWLKTAAVSAVATKYLSPESSKVVALFGTGRHARSQLHAHCEVRPIERVQAYSRRPEQRQAFCQRMSTELGIDVLPMNTPEEALVDADIVTTITTSGSPVFDGQMLEKRPILINALGAHYPWVREIDEQVVLKSHIILDEWCQGLQEQGEILMPMEAGLLREADIAGDLGGVVAGQVPTSASRKPWTLFLSGGTGVEDVAVASRLVREARAKGVGTEFEFNQPYEFEL